MVQNPKNFECKLNTIILYQSQFKLIMVKVAVLMIFKAILNFLSRHRLTFILFYFLLLSFQNHVFDFSGFFFFPSLHLSNSL